MELRPYGKNGENTTILGLGGAFLTGRSFEDGVATVHRALDLGIAYFDTSPMYCQGASQAVLGMALDGVTVPHLLATKLGYFAEPGRFRSPEALQTQFEENLRLLRRDRVDTLQLHEADMHVWWSTAADVKGRIEADGDYDFAAAPALEVLRSLKAAGRCRYIGISGNDADRMARIHADVEVDTLLMAFNYDLVRRRARRHLPAIGAAGTTRLLGAIFQRGLALAQPRLLEDPPPWMTPDLKDRYRRLYSLQQDSGLSLAALGIRFLAAQPDVEIIMVGAGLPAEIAECVAAVEQGPLPKDLHQAVEALGTQDNEAP